MAIKCVSVKVVIQVSPLLLLKNDKIDRINYFFIIFGNRLFLAGVKQFRLLFRDRQFHHP